MRMVCFVVGWMCLAAVHAAVAQGVPASPASAPPVAAARPARPAPPVRDPHTTGYVEAKDLISAHKAEVAVGEGVLQRC
jgi:hypothetical protein